MFNRVKDRIGTTESLSPNEKNKKPSFWVGSFMAKALSQNPGQQLKRCYRIPLFKMILKKQKTLLMNIKNTMQLKYKTL